MATSTTVPSDRITPVKATGTFKPALWNDRAYVAEEKLDGVRAVVYATAAGARVMVGERDITAQVPHLGVLHVPGLVLDGELVQNALRSPETDHVPGIGSASVTGIVNSSPGRAIETQKRDGFLKFYAFDCLHVGRVGRLNMRTQSWERRRAALVDVLAGLPRPIGDNYIAVPVAVPPLTREFYQRVVLLGGEGVVLKHREQSYTGVGWVKVKFRTTLSVVIAGINRDRESVAIAVYEDGKLSSVGDCGIKNTQLRAQAQLKPHTLVGRVLDVQAYAVSTRGKLRNPIWDRLRPDLFPKAITRDKLIADFEQAVEHA